MQLSKFVDTCLSGGFAGLTCLRVACFLGSPSLRQALRPVLEGIPLWNGKSSLSCEFVLEFSQQGICCYLEDPWPYSDCATVPEEAVSAIADAAGVSRAEMNPGLFHINWSVSSRSHHSFEKVNLWWLESRKRFYESVLASLENIVLECVNRLPGYVRKPVDAPGLRKQRLAAQRMYEFWSQNYNMMNDSWKYNGHYDEPLKLYLWSHVTPEQFPSGIRSFQNPGDGSVPDLLGWMFDRFEECFQLLQYNACHKTVHGTVDLDKLPVDDFRLACGLDAGGQVTLYRAFRHKLLNNMCFAGNTAVGDDTEAPLQLCLESELDFKQFAEDLRSLLLWIPKVLNDPEQALMHLLTILGIWGRTRRGL